MPEQLNYLTNLKTKLLPNESRLLELKYTGKQFGKMDESERWFGAQTLLLKIHAIKGWTIPASEMMDILIDQFQHKLEESYANVTVAEFEYAFRNSTDVKDWGKALNLSMIDEVMIPYLENRFDLSRQEEQLVKPLMIEEKREFTDADKLEWLNEWKREDINFELIPVIFYDYLTQFNLVEITPKLKWEAVEKATQGIKSMLQISVSENKGTSALRALGEFEKMEKEGFTGPLKERILNRAKKLIVAEYLKPPVADVKE